MSKMHYFYNKFFKIAKRWGLFAPQRPLNLQFWWSEVPWFGLIVVIQADYDEIEVQKIIKSSF